MDLTQEDNENHTPSPIENLSSLSPPNAPSKTPSTKDKSFTFRTTSSSFESKPCSSPFSSRNTPSPQTTKSFLDDPLDAPLSPSNPLPRILTVSYRVPTDRRSSQCQKKRDVTAKRIALLEVIKFGDSYEVPASTTTTDTTSGETSKKSRMTVTLTAEDMQKRKNDVKARTTLLLYLPDEHQLLFNIEVERDDLNQMFLTSLAPEWLMHTIVWRNRSDLDTMSLDDLYINLKIYESKVQKKSEPNSQNMAFISSAKQIRGNEDVSTASVSTASTNVPTASANIGVASISQDTTCAYIVSQSSGSQIKFKDINQINEDDMEEMDIKWSMALLSVRADKFWKKTGKKISIQGSDVAGFDKSKVECFNCHKMGHFVRECRAPRSQDRGRRDNYRQGSKVEEQAPKALMAIDEVGWDWSYMANDEEDRAFVADEEAPTEFALMDNTSAKSKVFDNSLCSKDYKNKEGLGYNAIPPPLAQIYSSPKKDLSWTGLLEFADDTVTDYSRPSPTMESASGDDQNRNPSVPKTDASPSTITPKPFIKFVKPNDSPSKSKTGKTETPKKSPVKYAEQYRKPNKKLNGSSQNNIDDKGYWDSGCSRHMTGNISYLSDYEPFDGGYVSFGQGGCKITGKGTIKTECIVLGRDFKLLDDANIFLRTPRQHKMYSIYFKNIVPYKDLTCLVAKASADECMLWHRRLGHLNFKIMNKLVRHNLVGGLLAKCFENDHTCTACLKGKQHKVSLTDHFSRFTWTFFLKSKDETSGILKKFITEIENLKDLKVKSIRCDNGGEFRNKEMNYFCLQKGIKREFSNARTPHQNGIIERRNRTLIEAARIMLADAKLPVTFWVEAVNTTCYVQNRVLVHNKTPYELFNGRSPAIGFFKPFGYHVMILNTFDNLGKFEEKGMKAIEKGAGPNWLFDIDSFTKSMSYVPVDAGIISTNILSTKDATSQEVMKDVSSLRYIALPNWAHDALLESSSSKPQDHYSTKVPESSGNTNPTASTSNPPADQMETLTVESPIPTVSSPVLTTCFTGSQEPSSDARLFLKRVANQVETPSLDNILTLTNRFEDILRGTTNSDESNGVEADVSNMETTITASPTPTLKIHKDHPKSQIIGPVDTSIQTKNKSKEISDAFQDPSRVEAMQPIGTKWVLKNKKDERDIVIRNKARLVAQGHTQEERIDYDEVFAPVVRIEAIRLFLAYASFTGFTVYQMDVKSAFLYGTIDKEVRQVTPKECHLHAVKRIFRYLKGHPKLGLWYPKESPFDLVAYSDSDYGGATQDHKSTTTGCQFLGRRLSMSCETLSREISTFILRFNTILARLQLCDYHNMVAILEKSEHNVDFHPMVDFVKASPLRRNLKLQDEEGISSLPDTELFENLTLMGYNISLNQMFTFQKGQFSHQWKYLIHTIMQCLSPKSTGFNEFSSNIATAIICLATNRNYNFSKMIFDGLVKNVNNKGEGSGTPTEPYHTPSPEAQQTSHTTHSSPTIPSISTISIPPITSSDTPPLKQYTRRSRISQSSVLQPVADEPASSLRCVSQGETCPIDSGFIADQDRATIAKSSTLPYDSAPRVTSPAIDEGTQEVEINRLKARVKLLEDREGLVGERSGDDAPIKGRNLDEGEAAAKKVSDDTEEMATVLTSMDAVTILAAGVADVPTGSGSIPTASPDVPTGSGSIPAASPQVPTGSDVVPTASLVFSTATVVTPYRRKKGKEVMVESKTLKKQKVQEQIDTQVAKELEEQLEREDQRIHEQFASELPLERRIELISDLVRYQDNYAKLEDFIPMGSKEMAERLKRKGLSLEQESMKKLKTSEEVSEEAKSPDEVPEGKHLDREDLNQLWALVKESLSNRPPTIDKEMTLWLYDMCGVHQVTFKDKEIFMLVEKDYPLRKGLALMMI
nr:hypothetical protein [Tanacetum cinerariifolium]